MGKLLLGVMLACALVCATPAVATAAQAPKYVRTIPVVGLDFDVDWTNKDIYAAGESTTVARYDLVAGGLEKSWSVPVDSIINDVAAVKGGVYVAAAGTRRLYAYNANGTSVLQTDANTQNRIGDVRGMVVANTGAYLVGNPGTILRISANPFGYPQLVGGWGVATNTDAGWQTCSPSQTPPPYCYGSGYSGEELGKVTDARDLDMRENVEGTGNFALFVLERRPLSGGYDYRVSVFSDEGVAPSFAPQGFIFGGSSVSNAGSGAGQLSGPHGIALDVKRGRIYIADEGNNRVAVYTFGGQFLQAFGWGVDTGADKLEACTLQSTCQAGLTSGHLYIPRRVQVDPSNGDVYVSHIGGISQFKMKGSVKAPKDVKLQASPTKVKKNTKTTLTASLLPCKGTQGEPIVFEKKVGNKWKRAGGGKADVNCRMKISPKVKAQTTYRARSPETNDFLAGTSKAVTVEVKPKRSIMSRTWSMSGNVACSPSSVSTQSLATSLATWSRSPSLGAGTCSATGRSG
jgi:hypothetical protein